LTAQQIFVISTTLEAIDQAPWQSMPPTSRAAPRDPAKLPESTDVLLVGASSAGLAAAGYLKALGVDFVQCDAIETMGDSWGLVGHFTRSRDRPLTRSQRYDCVKLHTIRAFSGAFAPSCSIAPKPDGRTGLPYQGFPEDYPQYVPSLKIAEFYRHYAENMDLPIYLSRLVTKARWDEERKAWRVPFNGKFGPEEIIAKHLIFAVGIFGRTPTLPKLPNEVRALCLCAETMRLNEPRRAPSRGRSCIRSSIPTPRPGRGSASSSSAPRRPPAIAPTTVPSVAPTSP
jgi:hypothetical protein